MVDDAGQSILGAIGSSSPLRSPPGFGAWQAAVALLAGLVAKEAVVSSLCLLYGFSTLDAGSTIAAALSSTFQTPVAAYAFLVFILLYVPCVAAVSTLYREMNSRSGRCAPSCGSCAPPGWCPLWCSRWAACCSEVNYHAEIHHLRPGGRSSHLGGVVPHPLGPPPAPGAVRLRRGLYRLPPGSATAVKNNKTGPPRTRAFRGGPFAGGISRQPKVAIYNFSNFCYTVPML